MAQVVRDWPLTTKAQVHAWLSPRGICGGQSGTRTGFSLSSSLLPCQYHSTMALHAHISLTALFLKLLSVMGWHIHGLPL
jgi:hypothetical protein